jgi:hypothetical protein
MPHRMRQRGLSQGEWLVTASWRLAA